MIFFLDNYDLPMRHPHDNFQPMMEPPDFDPRMDMPEFDRRGPQVHIDGFEPDRFDRRDRRGDFVDDMMMMDEFEPRMRGPPGPPGPDFFPSPRDGFGPPRGPLIRGPPGPPDGFGPRMPPRPLGPRMFHPRGPMMRGPRPGMYF